MNRCKALRNTRRERYEQEENTQHGHVDEMLTMVLEKLHHINTGNGGEMRKVEMCVAHHATITCCCISRYDMSLIRISMSSVVDVLTQALKHDESLTRVALVMTEVLTRQLKLEATATTNDVLDIKNMDTWEMSMY